MNNMEAQLIGLGIETFKVALYLSLPGLLAGMILGFVVSIFQATTQINEMTLSFIPKILAVVAVMVLLMPWMVEIMKDFTLSMFNLIPTFIQ